MAGYSIVAHLSVAGRQINLCSWSFYMIDAQKILEVSYRVASVLLLFFRWRWSLSAQVILCLQFVN